MDRSLSFHEFRRAFSGFDEPRSVAAFERRARAEMAVLCGIAGVALLSVLLSLQSMHAVPEGSESALAAVPSAEPALAFERREAPVEVLETASVDAVRDVAAESDQEASEPEPLERRPDSKPADARSEASWYAEYSAVVGAEKLALELRTSFDGDATVAQRMAALRISYDRQLPGTAALFERASQGGEPLSNAAVNWLERRASREIRARELLESLTLSPTLRDETRAASARALIASVDDGEAARIVARLGRDRSDLVYENARAALAERSREREPEALR